VVSSLLKALDILELFGASEPRLSLAQISQRLRLPKSTAHNLLTTLMSRGYVEKPDREHYALGTAVYPLTQAVRVNVEIRDRAAPLLREMADAARASVYLTVLDHGRAMYIYAVESPQRLLARSVVGDRADLHCTSVGKAMLAFLPEETIRRLVKQGLPAFTRATITDGRALGKELEQIRARGFAVDRSEHEDHTYCVGAPIFNERGRVIAACSISGVDPEIVRRRLAENAARVTGVAQEISRRMGYVPSRPSLVTAPPPRRAAGRSA
jgi:DNA-binding IclR family transcriptional regulator